MSRKIILIKQELLLLVYELNRSGLLRSEERFSRNAETDLVCRLLLEKKKTVEQNLVARIDGKGLVSVNEASVISDVNKTYRVCQTYTGGKDWPMGAYNPKTNIMFMPLSNACIDETARTDREAKPEFVYNTTNVGHFPPGKDKVGRIDAISVETGRTVWSWETRVANYSPLLATGSGLLFNGGLDQYLVALDVDTGQGIRATRLPSQTIGGAITYSINGRQY